MSLDVAIVGIGCLLPGARGAEALWAHLLAGHDAVGEPDPVDWAIDPHAVFEVRRGAHDKTCSLLGGWIGGGEERLLEWPVAVGREALKGARVERARCGLVLGGYPWAVSAASRRLFGGLYDEVLGLDAPAPPPPAEPLLAGSVAPAVAAALGLGGQRFAIDAACATSLYAIKLAALQLRAGRADAMLAGASSAYDPAFTCLGFATLQALPEATRSRPLDARSDGLAPAEGCCLFVLKRHTDARRDGDRVYGVVRAVGLSSDGRGQHLLAPARRGQLAAYGRAYEEAEVAPADVSYVECHATGTRVGDRVEADGIAEFFGARAPLLGSVKSNLGHLLIAAGGASLTKLLLAFERGTIPPTIGVEEPLTTGIVREPRAWDGDLAAINAFGFGGTNAHLVLERAGAEPSGEPLAPAPLAIVGMDAVFGTAHGLEAFARTVYDGSALSRHGAGRRLADAVAPERAAYLGSLELDALRFRVPPAELERLNPQHLLALHVADRALVDAGLSPGGRVAVLVALAAEPSIHRLQARWELEARAGTQPDAVKDRLHRAVDGDFAGYIGNLAASRVAALWDFSGPAFAVAAGENGTARCLQIAELLLAAGDADAVVVAAVDLAAGPESRALRGARGPLADGAGALVVKRQDAVTGRVYATVRAVHVEEPDTRPPAEVVAAGARQALAGAGLAAADVGYVEAGWDDAATFSGLGEALAGDGGAMIGSVKTRVGDACAASGAAALIRAVLCLSRRYLPADGLTAPAGLYTCAKPQPWLRDAASRSRVALVHGCASDGSSAHVVLGEGSAAVRPVQPGSRPLLVLPVGGETMADVAAGVAVLERELAAGTPLEALSRRLTAHVAGRLAACVVARGAEEARAEARLVMDAARDGRRCVTPAGSAFTPAPVSGGVAFVYAGVNAAFPGACRELFQLWPELHLWMERRFHAPREAACDELLGGRWQRTPTGEELEALEERLGGSAPAQLTLAALLPALSTRHLREGLGLHPDSALGYSFGEVAMQFALGVWEAGDEWLSRLASDAVIHERLGGPKLAIREAWGLAPGEALDWAAWVLLAPAAHVAALIDGRDGIHLTNICAPREVVIAGRAAECRALIEASGLDAFRAPAAIALHCPPARAEHGRLAALLTDTTVPSGITLRLAAGEGELPQRLATGLVERADFPRQVDAAWASGDRVFVEVGPGATCTRWISETLRDRQHVAVAASRRGVDESTSIAQLVARLTAERVPLALAAWGEAGTGSAQRVPKLAFRLAADAPTILPLAAARVSAPARDEALAAARVSAPARDEALAAAQASAPARDEALATAQASAPARNEALATARVSAHARDEGLAAAQASAPGGAEPAFAARAFAASVAGSEASPAARGGGMGVADPFAREAVLAARRRASAHRAFLRSSDQLLRAAAGGLAPRVLYDEGDLLEFAEGRLARVLGPHAAAVDELPLRVRLPGPPFLAVSRVTRLDAQWGRIGPGSITTEYDIPSPAWNAVDGQCSYLALDAQGLLFLLGAMGIDVANQGRRAFRWLDATITFLAPMPRAGDTVTYEIAISEFVHEGDAVLFFADFHATVGGAPVMRIDRCCAGFFTQADLAAGEGITDAHRRTRPPARARSRLPLPCDRRSFDAGDLDALRRGDLASCFGPGHANTPPNPSLRLPPAAMLMIDRVISVDPGGGPLGLGELIAEKDLHPDDWYLRAHFKDDPVFAGPCMLEGSLQALQFFALFGGLHAHTRGARFQPLTHHPLTVRFRGQVPPGAGTVRYTVQIVERTLDAHPCLVADVDLGAGGRTIGRLEGIGIRLA